VERLLRGALSGAPDGVPFCPTPADSLRWAGATGPELRGTDAPGRGKRNRRDRRDRYRGLPPVAVWGTVEQGPARGAGAARRGATPGEDDPPLDSRRVHTLRRRPRVRHAPEDEDDDKVGMWMVQIDDPQESVEDPMGLQRPTDRDDDADAADLADSLAELPEARLVPVPGRPREVLASEDPPPRQASAEAGAPRRVGVAYPEWDWRTERYHPKRAVVREREAEPGNPAWAEQALARHAREVQHVRRRFERLRPQRVRLTRQADGPDVDLAAYVTSHADRHAGRAPDDRLYETVRPARRDVAILLLVDVSGSTDSWVADTRRIVDVEKEALIVVCEALDALGDGYAVMAFSGEGPASVSVATVKDFSERNGLLVRRRIAALEPDRFTRTGAAIRHATAALSAQTARHRLLLVLSDGKPNDVDVYEGRYGVEDTRQAVAEARMQGLHAFCLTVDRQAPVYLPRIFGPSGYAVLRHAATLPHVLVDVVRLLLRS
jgi:nitric oxide reductase NorD protein